MKKSTMYLLCLLLMPISYFLYQPTDTLATRSKMQTAQYHEESNKTDLNAVPTVERAIQIAESLLKDRYGESYIEQQKPLAVSLENNIWTIHGSTSDKKQQGTACIRIDKRDGAVLDVSIID